MRMVLRFSAPLPCPPRLRPPPARRQLHDAAAASPPPSRPASQSATRGAHDDRRSCCLIPCDQPYGSSGTQSDPRVDKFSTVNANGWPPAALTARPRNSDWLGSSEARGGTALTYSDVVAPTRLGGPRILHIGQATYYRMWWLFPTACLCGLGEVVGWSGRLWSSFSLSLFDPYLMQICCTVISPTPLIAVNFILLSWVVTRLVPCYARLTPIQYTMVFVACDIVALIVQGAGGGIASTAATLDGANMGAHIMLGGIVFQFCAIVVYSVLAADLLYSYSTDRPRRAEPCAARGAMDGKLRTMICALALSTLVLFIRGIYRIVELSGGWSGRVLHTEVYFNVLDGGWSSSRCSRSTLRTRGGCSAPGGRRVRWAMRRRWGGDDVRSASHSCV
ncbi:RTA1 like protein-domain-containing protein [Mycena pura]|uniref:RTA1 like protein-domain-containing protein n=1 Tax=Mycena pura TaxID=153505 RepID=A0AAD6UT99_9AGAR|nr:RTA1 like protein-domain-containing protein [Mycena pura]